MKKLISALVLTCAGCGALAGEPLFGSSPPQWRHEDSALSDRLKALPSAKIVTAFTLNRAAFQGDSITVSVNNKTYTFVGKVTRFAATPDALTWSGTQAGPTSVPGILAPDGRVLSFNRLSISVADGADGGVFGNLDVDGAHYTIHGARGAATVFLVEHGASHLPLAKEG